MYNGSSIKWDSFAASFSPSLLKAQKNSALME
jgi:hypothetical protein